MTAKQRHRQGVFTRGPVICALAYRGRCSGQLQADHVIEVSEIRDAWQHARYTGAALGFARLDDLIADDRNGWLLCERHHNLKSRRLLQPWPRRRDLPRTVFQFARLFPELGVLLDRRFPAA